MRLEGYGVCLESLTPETAEWVRRWRNHPRIREQMEYRETITPGMQTRWLASVQNERYAYFLIRAGGEPVGMIHLSHIDADARTAEAGLFIGEERFSGTGIALSASLLVLEYAFGKLSLLTVSAKVKNENRTAEKYNALLGFSDPQPCSPGFNRWTLDEETFRRRKPGLVNLVAAK